MARPAGGTSDSARYSDAEAPSVTIASSFVPTPPGDSQAVTATATASTATAPRPRARCVLSWFMAVDAMDRGARRECLKDQAGP
ncbi:hypothetical protein Pen01_29010 [Phytomonospora endophytica]|nr:hypothetical protein Pen01_29010 [Phytomonospora endophytica]